MCIGATLQSWWHSNSSLLPTVMRNGVIDWGLRPKANTKWWQMKLCVLPPSINICTFWFEMRPTKRKVSGTTWPAIAWKLIWVGDRSTLISVGLESKLARVSSKDPSSSSATSKKIRKENLWPRENLSSQLKHKPFSCRVASSLDESLLKGMGGGLVGMGSNDLGVGGGGDGGCREETGPGEKGGRGLKWLRRRESKNFSSCKWAKTPPELELMVAKPAPPDEFLVRVRRWSNLVEKDLVAQQYD